MNKKDKKPEYEVFEMKKIVALTLTLILLVSLCACGGRGGAKEIDLEALAQELTAAGIFTDTMSRAGDDLPARIYGLGEGDAVKTVLYTGTGATAEEIFLAQAVDSSAADSLKTACEQRVENQKLAFRSYAPGEVDKLDSAVIAVSGNTVILVVSADAAAVRVYLNDAFAGIGAPQPDGSVKFRAMLYRPEDER